MEEAVARKKLHFVYLDRQGSFSGNKTFAHPSTSAMPRLTRSKRVANLVHEDEVSAEEIPLPPSPDNRTDSRAPLGEIEILNLEQPAPLVVEMTEAIEAVKKSNSKEKAKGGRKGKKGKKNAVEKDIVEESRSIPEVEAVKAACEDLMNGNTRGAESVNIH